MKKRKKNPNTDYLYYRLLVNTIDTGSAPELVCAIVYYKQGNICKDCNKKYYACVCEKCNDCGFNRCLCDLKLPNVLNPYLSNNELLQIMYTVRKIAFELAKITLNPDDYENFLIKIKDYQIESSVKIPKIDQKWLASK